MIELNVELPDIPCMYYEIDELTDCLQNNNGLFVFHQNIRSFQRNFDDLSVLISQFSAKMDVIVLTETWFSYGLCQEIDGYVGFHVFRSEREGGGVSVYVRQGIKCSQLTEYSTITDSHEICAVELSLQQNTNLNNFTLICVYRPPDASLPLLADHLSNLLTNLASRSIILCGDLNIDLLREELYLDFFQFALFIQLFFISNSCHAHYRTVR